KQLGEPARVTLRRSLRERLAPLELLLQERGRQGGVGLAQRLGPVQRKQLLRTPDRTLQRPARLVHAGRRLQREAPLRFRSGRVAIGMDPALQRAIGRLERVERRRIQTVSTRQAEQREVVLREIDQTLKLSPQPHSSFTLGLLNLNPSFNPSR